MASAETQKAHIARESMQWQRLQEIAINTDLPRSMWDKAVEKLQGLLGIDTMAQNEQ
jgi:hypothetical protein